MSDVTVELVKSRLVNVGTGILAVKPTFPSRVIAVAGRVPVLNMTMPPFKLAVLPVLLVVMLFVP